MNRAHLIDITKACTVAFMKAAERNVSIGKKKTKDGEKLFFKALTNRFWLTSKSSSWFKKVVHA